MKQILIVEDDNLLNKTLAYNLASDDYAITNVLNARAAAEALKAKSFDLVLLDINLPDGNGGYISDRQRSGVRPDMGL